MTLSHLQQHPAFSLILHLFRGLAAVPLMRPVKPVATDPNRLGQHPTKSGGAGVGGGPVGDPAVERLHRAHVHQRLGAPGAGVGWLRRLVGGGGDLRRRRARVERRGRGVASGLETMVGVGGVVRVDSTGSWLMAIRQMAFAIKQ